MWREMKVRFGIRRKTLCCCFLCFRACFCECIRCVCSLRVYMGCTIFVGLASLGSLLVLMSTLINSQSLQSILGDKQMMVASFVNRVSSTWLEQGKKIVDLQLDYLYLHEEEIGDLEFRNDNPFIQRFTLHMYQIVKASQHISFVGGGTPYGTAFFATDRGIWWTNETLKDYPCCNYSENHRPGPLWLQTVYPNWTLSERFLPPDGSVHYDYRLLADGWWQNGAIHRDYYWSNFMTTTNELTSTITKQYYDRNGTWRGVFGCWFTLVKFKDFLHEIVGETLRGNGIIYIIDVKTGELIATSNGAKIMTRMDDSDELVDISMKTVRIKPEDSEDKDISATARYIMSKYSSWKNVKSEHGLRTGNNIITVEPLSITGFEIVFVFIENYYEVHGKYLLLNAVICLSVTLVSILFTFCPSAIIVYCITRPLVSIIKKMKKIEKMELDGIKNASCCYSPLSEVRNIQKSFFFTVEKLKEYRAFLPLELRGVEEFSGLSRIKERIVRQSSSGNGSSGSGSSGCGSSPSRNRMKRKNGKKILKSSKSERAKCSGSDDNQSSYGSDDGSSVYSGETESIAFTECSVQNVKSKTLLDMFRCGITQSEPSSCLVILCILNFQQFLDSTKENEILKFSGRLFTKINSDVYRFRGFVYLNFFSKFILFFRTPNLAMECAKSLHKFFTVDEDGIVKHRILIHSPEVHPLTIGTAGNDNVRKKFTFCPFLSDLEYLCAIEPSFQDEDDDDDSEESEDEDDSEQEDDDRTNVSEYGQNGVGRARLSDGIFVTEFCKNVMSERYSVKPVEILNNCFGVKKCLIYRYTSTMKLGDDEWMYEMRNQNIHDMYTKLAEGCIKMIDDDDEEDEEEENTEDDDDGTERTVVQDLQDPRINNSRNEDLSAVDCIKEYLRCHPHDHEAKHLLGYAKHFHKTTNILEVEKTISDLEDISIDSVSDDDDITSTDICGVLAME